MKKCGCGGELLTEREQSSRTCDSCRVMADVDEQVRKLNRERGISNPRPLAPVGVCRLTSSSAG